MSYKIVNNEININYFTELFLKAEKRVNFKINNVFKIPAVKVNDPVTIGRPKFKN